MFPHPWVPLHSLQSVGGENGGKDESKIVPTAGPAHRYIERYRGFGDGFVSMRGAFGRQQLRDCGV